MQAAPAGPRVPERATPALKASFTSYGGTDEMRSLLLLGAAAIMAITLGIDAQQSSAAAQSCNCDAYCGRKGPPSRYKQDSGSPRFRACYQRCVDFSRYNRGDCPQPYKDD